MRSTASSMPTSKIPVRAATKEIRFLHSTPREGLKHSAFTILNEGRIQNSPYLARHIPRGELIDLLGKALLYVEVESHWRRDAVTTNCNSGFSLLEPHVCSSESVASKPPVVSLPPASSAAPQSLSAKSQSQASSSSRQPLPQTSSQMQNSQQRISSGPPESVSTSSKAGPSTATLDAEAPSPAPTPSTSLEAGSKRKSSPVPVSGPQEKRQKTEPPSRELPRMFILLWCCLSPEVDAIEFQQLLSLRLQSEDLRVIRIDLKVQATISRIRELSVSYPVITLKCVFSGSRWTIVLTTPRFSSVHGTLIGLIFLPQGKFCACSNCLQRYLTPRSLARKILKSSSGIWRNKQRVRTSLFKMGGCMELWAGSLKRSRAISPRFTGVQTVSYWQLDPTILFYASPLAQILCG